MHRVIIFPNEDSFYKSMGIEVYENYKSYSNFFTEASKSARMNLRDCLIYDNIPYIFDVISRRVAVLVTSIGFYQLWKETYQMEGDQFVGYGSGYLAALVCEGILKFSDAIAMIRNKSVNEKAVPKQVVSRTFCLSKGRIAESRQDILEELQYSLFEVPDDNELNAQIKKINADVLLEIGPDNKTVKKLEKTENTINGWLDIKKDNNYILENLIEKKFFNRQFGVRKILANIVSTQNYNTEESSQDIVLECYSKVRNILDDSVQNQTNQITDRDFNSCMECLKDNFEAKKVTKDEIEKRLYKSEIETLIDFCNNYRSLVKP